MSNIEAICSALNLCRFLLLREQATGSNLTEVIHLQQHALAGLPNWMHCQTIQALVRDYNQHGSCTHIRF